MQKILKQTLAMATFGIIAISVHSSRAEAAEKMSAAEMSASSGSHRFKVNPDLNEDGKCCDGIGSPPTNICPEGPVNFGPSECKYVSSLDFPVCTTSNVSGPKLCLGADWISCVKYVFTKIPGKTCEDIDYADAEVTSIYSPGCYNSMNHPGCAPH